MAERSPETAASGRTTHGPGVVRTGLLSMVALVALGGTRLIHGSLVSRATDTDTYGVVGSLIAITTIASLLLPAGVASAAARFIPYEHGRDDLAAARAVHRFLDRLGLPGAVALGLGAALGAAAAFSLDSGQTAEVFALAVAFAVYSIDKATLYGFGRVGAYVRLELASSVLILLATIGVLALDTGTYLLPLALGYACFAVGARIVLRRDVQGEREERAERAPQPRAKGKRGEREERAERAPQPRAKGKRGPATPVRGRREILRFVVLACIGTLASQGFLQGTQLLANWFAAPAEVAYFVAAVTLVAPMYFLPRALGLALFPAMSRAHGAGDVAEVRRQADLSTRALLVVLAPLFAAGILLSREALTIFGSARYASGAPVLQLILAATYFAVVAVAAVNSLSSGDHVHVPVISGVVGCLVGLGTVALLGGPLGAVGVGLGYLVGTAVTAGGPVGTAWRLHRMPWRAPLLWSVANVVIALAAAAALNRLAVTGAERVAVDVGAAVVAVLLAVAVLRRQLTAVLAQARQARWAPR